MYSYRNAVQDAAGNAQAGALVQVFKSDGTTPAVIFGDFAGTSVLPTNELTTDARGQFKFYGAPGLYDIKVTPPGGAPVTLDDIVLGVPGYFHPEDFGCVGDGTTDDGPRLAAMGLLSAGTRLKLTPGKVYRSTVNLSFANGTVLEAWGATIWVDRNDTSNNAQLAFGVKCRIEGLTIELRAGNYCERLLSLADDCSTQNLSVTSVDQINVGDDNLDGAIQARGNRITLVDTFVRNFDRPLFSLDADRLTVDGFTAESFHTGINLRGANGRVALSRLIFDGASPNAGTNPGTNAIVGGANDLTIDGVLIKQTGEHAIYLSAESGLTGTNLRITGVMANQVGQCVIKLRYWDVVTIDGVRAVDCAYSSATGTNEDGIRLEKCSNVTVDGAYFTRKLKGNCCFNAIHCDGVTNLRVNGVSAQNPLGSLIEIQDVAALPTVGQPSGEIFIGDASCLESGAAAIKVVTTTGIGSFVVQGLDVDNLAAGAPILEWNVTGIVTGRQSIRGHARTSATNPINNVSGQVLDLGITLPVGRITYDAASLVDGAGATTGSITVVGARPGDIVTVGHSVAVAGMTVTGWVSANDTVLVRFQNESGGTLDLASGTLKVQVLKV